MEEQFNNTKSIPSKKEMTAADAVRFVNELENNNIEVWLDGGWGVDSLLGKQTRRHWDTDIVIRTSDISQFHDALAPLGFSVIDNEKPWNFVVGDAEGRKIDVHAVDFDEHGNGIYGPQDEKTVMYPASSFLGQGVINDYPVKCLTPEYQVESHTGYELDEDDFSDVSALHQKFGVELPEEYRNWPHAKESGHANDKL